MGRHRAGHGAGALRHAIGQRLARRQAALQPGGQAGHRVQVPARDRSKRNQQRQQTRAGGQRVAEQRQRGIAIGQPFRADAGADHDGDQQGRADPFGHQPAGEGGQGRQRAGRQAAHRGRRDKEGPRSVPRRRLPINAWQRWCE
ncbi:hypothetical protein D3C86_1648080 [compost metagenome]